MHLSKSSLPLIFLATLIGLFSIGQDQSPIEIAITREDPKAYCATDQIWAELLRESPETVLRQKQLDAAAFRNFQTKQNSQQRMVADYTLPIVVHIIHQNGTENINDAQVIQGVQDLNDAYANIGYYNPATGADTRIEFCLARRDPDGNATTGITRTVSPLTEYNYSVDDINMKNLNRWDPTRYINIWLAKEICSNNGCGVAGYAYFPSSHGGSRDGIAQEARWFGSSQGKSGVQIHEMGHYLGVYHTFQGACPNNDCLLDGDRVCDTPPDQSTAVVPCGGTSNSCNTDVNLADPNNPFTSDQEDMYWNYMDYGDFNCYSAFTPGQVDRMHFFLTGTRASLLDSDGCLDPCLSGINAFFTASSTMANVGQTINFTNASTNATTFLWEVNGLSQATTANTSYTFNAIGTYTISLTVFNADPNCKDTYTIEIKVTCPVDASFSLSPQLAQPGDLISFVNNSTNATSYDWTVNSGLFSNATTPDYTVPDPGLYTFCLIADNGFCTDQHCETVLVGPGQIECEETFLKTYGDPNTNEELRTIVSTPDGNLIMGGQLGNAALLVGLGIEGQILWQKTLDITSRADQIYDMILASDGHLVGVGMTERTPSGRNCFAFKYDWQNHTLLWSRTFSNPELSSLVKILEIGSGNYTVFGQLLSQSWGDGCNGLWMELDKNDGSKIQAHDYYLGSCETFSAADYWNDQYYVTGRYNFAGGGASKMRIGISLLDLNGNQNWSRLYIENVNGNARMYSTDIKVENDHLIVVGQGDRNGTSITNVVLTIFSTTLSGDIEWAKNLDISGGEGERIQKMFSLPDGYLLVGYFVNNGTSNSDIFLIKTDKQGNALWAKAFDVGQEDEGLDLAIQAGFIFLSGKVGQSGSSSLTDALVAKLTLEGETTEPCEYIRNLDIVQTSIASPYDGNHPLTLRSNAFNFQNTGAPIQDATLETEVYCSAPCVEICDNDIDDDGDGQVDEYDADCDCLVYDCDNNVFLDCPDCQAAPPLSSSWEVQTIWSYDIPDVTSTQTLVVGDIDGDCIPDVVVLSRDANAIIVIDGQTGALKFQVPTYETGAGALGQVAIGDVDRNGATDIFILSGNESSNPVDKRHRLIRYEYDGSGLSERFVSKEAIGPYSNFDEANGPRYDVLNINIADINGDGRPEVIVGNEIFDAINGDFLVGGGADNSIASPQIWIGNTNLSRVGSYPVVADVLPDAYCVDCSGLELVAGNMVYAINLPTTGGPNSGTMTVAVDMSSRFNDGMVSIADLNFDGLLDVVTSEGDPQKGDRLYITAWNPVLGVIYDRLTIDGQQAYGPSRTGIANLDDQAGDLEIAFHFNPFLYTYKFNPSGNNFSLVAKTGVDDPSQTGVSIFDFNGDGQNEVLYRDENELRILRGSDLMDLVSPTFNCTSKTSVEYPFVVDVNADGQAEIITMCGGHIEVIGNAENGKFWASARKVWNQYSYFNVNINDDLTIPIQQQAHHLTSDSINFNTFLKQYSNPNFPVANAGLNIDSVTCLAGDSVSIALEICNTGDNILSMLTPIAVYIDNPTTTTATLLEVFLLGANLPPDSCLSISPTFFFVGSGQVFIVVNDNASLSPPFSLPVDFPVTTIPECDYTNNLDSIIIDANVNQLDLGPDIAVCDNGIWLLDAGPGFQIYRWQNGSTQQAYTAWEPGIYWVEVEDLCGNVLRDSILITTLENTIVNLPNDLVLCEGDSVSLDLNGFDTYQWWPGAALDCDDCPNVKIKPIDSTLVIVLVSTMDGCYSTDSILITIQKPIEISKQNYICSGDTIEVHGQYVWSPGTYTFTGSSVNGCDSIHITELLPATAYLTEMDSIYLCTGDTAIVFGEKAWEEGFYDRAYTSEEGCDSVLRIFVALHEELLSVDSINICERDTLILFGEKAWAEGIYSESYTGSNNCDSTAFVFLFVESLAVAESTTQLCTGDTIEYLGISITTAGTYEIVQPITGSCDSLYRLLVEEIMPMETEETRLLCPNDSIEIFGNLIGQIGVYDSLFSSALTGCDSLHTIIVEAANIIEEMQVIQLCFGETALFFGDTIDQPGVYQNWVLGVIGCDTLHTTTLEWWPEPILDWQTKPACADQNNGRINLFPSGANPPFDTHWETDSLAGINLENISPGFYPLILSDANGCTISAVIEVEEKPSPRLLLEDSLILGLGQMGHIDLQVFPSDFLHYEWSPAMGLSCTDCAEPELIAINNITYYLTVSNAAGCEVSGQISLRVRKDRKVYIPNAFSPNGDGINDWLTVFSDESVEKVIYLRIYDRWGEEVFHLQDFQTNDLSLGWDGTFKNRDMDPAVFVYTAKVLFKDGITDVLAGDVVLIR